MGCTLSRPNFFRFFTKPSIFPSGEKGEKSRNRGKTLMSTVLHNSCGKALWITLVENSVENVENSQLSTGIFPLCSFGPCGKAAYEKCITCGIPPGFSCYVSRIPPAVMEGLRRKSWEFFRPSRFTAAPGERGFENFVNIPQISSGYDFSSPGNTIHQVLHRRFVCKER